VTVTAAASTAAPVRTAYLGIAQYFRPSGIWPLNRMSHSILTFLRAASYCPLDRSLSTQRFCKIIRLHFPFLGLDRKSTRLNSSHVAISYAVFCLKKKTRED